MAKKRKSTAAAKSPNPLLSAPRSMFGEDPEINSEHELNEAIGEIGYLNAVLAARDAELQAEITQLREDHANGLTLRVGMAEALPIDEHIETLQEAIRSYCQKHREQFLPAGKKSRKLSQGTAGWRAGKDSVKLLPGQTDSAVLKVIDAASGALNKMRKLMESLFFTKTRALSLICEPALKLSKTKTLAAYREGKIKADHLEAVGLQVVEGQEEFFVKPDEVTLQNEAA